MKRHHSNGRTLAMEDHTPGGGGRLPPIGGRHSHTPRGGWASTRGVQRPISPQVLTKLSRPPPVHSRTAACIFLGLRNTCGNRNGLGMACGQSHHPATKVLKVLRPNISSFWEDGTYIFLSDPLRIIEVVSLNILTLEYACLCVCHQKTPSNTLSTAAPKMDSG